MNLKQKNFVKEIKKQNNFVKEIKKLFTAIRTPTKLKVLGKYQNTSPCLHN